MGKFKHILVFWIRFVSSYLRGSSIFLFAALTLALLPTPIESVERLLPSVTLWYLRQPTRFTAKKRVPPESLQMLSPVVDLSFEESSYNPDSEHQAQVQMPPVGPSKALEAIVSSEDLVHSIATYVRATTTLRRALFTAAVDSTDSP